ncbi:MAG: permease prefix domain 1-containing protein [Anaerolineae bacterium]
MPSLEEYLSHLKRQLYLDRTTNEKILQEIRSHLVESAAGLHQKGYSPEESIALAIARFGEAEKVAEMMRQVYVESANQAVLAALLPVALTMAFKWVILPFLERIGSWQGNPTPAITISLALLALLIPGLTMRRWRYGYAAWAFFSLIAIAQM